MKALVINISALIAGGAFMASVVGGVMYAQPILSSNPPPWEGIKEANDSLMKVVGDLVKRDNDTKSLVVKGQILAAWGRCDTARKSRDPKAIDYQEQLADLQVSYMLLTGDNYPIGTCP